MSANVPLQFNYIPYPLWRRRWPGLLRPLLEALWPRIYPVDEDRNPPQDPATMANYLIHYRLLPGMDTEAIQQALTAHPAEVEHAPDSSPIPAPETPVRLPAQWEPMEAVIVNWPVLYPPLWPLHAQMVEAIAPVAAVIVTVPAPMWAHAAHLFLAMRGHLGEQIDRVRFLVVPTDDIWVRDYGPIIGYDGNGGRVAINAIYDHLPNFPQVRDNAMPARWAAHTGMPLRDLKLHSEGGNLWSDGDGTLIMTEKIITANPPHTYESLQAYLRGFFDFEKLIITPRMAIESTGHVDLLVKPVDAATVLVSAPTTRTSAYQLRQTADLFRRETNARGKPYTVIELPTPPLYINWLAFPIRRSYSNALTINGRVLVPVYDIPDDERALRIYADAMPDYAIIPIDCRVGANGGGAVHCMTKEIPRPP
jgi:agmatine deiminase